MLKDAYYFSHDINARRDPKCAALIHDFGIRGYGLYWAIIEILHEQRDGKLEKFPKLYDGLSHQFNTTKDEITKLIEAMLHDYELLQEDEKYIWSDRVCRNLLHRKRKFEEKSQAGRIGGLKSGESRRTKQNEAVLEANEQKERKGKNTTDAPTKRVRDYFYGKYEKTQGKKYLPSYGKDSKIIANTLKVVPEDEALLLIDRFFESTDPFIVNGGYSLGIFNTKIHALRAGKKEVVRYG